MDLTKQKQTAQVKSLMAVVIAMYPPHTKDTDCAVDEETGECAVCGAWGSSPCPQCQGVRYHKPGCPEIDGQAVAVNF